MSELPEWWIHGDGDLIEVTWFGSDKPTYLPGLKPSECNIAQAKALYVDGRLSVETLESLVERALTHG